jgi:hypothetical protein
LQHKRILPDEIFCAVKAQHSLADWKDVSHTGNGPATDPLTENGLTNVKLAVDSTRKVEARNHYTSSTLALHNAGLNVVAPPRNVLEDVTTRREVDAIIDAYLNAGHSRSVRGDQTVKHEANLRCMHDRLINAASQAAERSRALRSQGDSHGNQSSTTNVTLTRSHRCHRNRWQVFESQSALGELLIVGADLDGHVANW